MAARPPTGDGTDPEAIEFGIAALAADLDEADLTFPAETETIADALDHVAVPVDANETTVTIDDALVATERTQFESRNQLLNELHPVFEAYRAEASTSLVGRLRGLLPF
ncbi:hypothetical protein ACFQJC_08690 [Haloferax namakaokahaiae]|uniref:Uncharacterized protein n=1 Tax=Haloferax namakaokahaiae TaxID=1748331 RepID=A0ABD5ZE70_9EURY